MVHGDSSWQQILDRVAPRMADFHAEQGTSRQTEIRFMRVLDALGLRASYDRRTQTQTQTPGYYLLSMDGVVPVVGAKDGAAVFLHHTTEKPTYEPDDTVLAVFLHEGSRMRGYILERFTGDEGTRFQSVSPTHAALAGDRLLVSGLYRWFSNGAQVAVQSYARTANGWSPMAEKIAEFESWNPPRLEISPDGKSVLPVLFESRTYPKHLDACHATAELTYVEQWEFPGGRPKLAWKRLRDTPYNVLDRLYAAIESKDVRAIRRRSASRLVRQGLVALHARALRGRPAVEFPNSYSFGDATVLGIENLQTTFHFGRRHGRWMVVRLGPARESM
jgi:hypothetical protein